MAHKVYATPRVTVSESACTFQESGFGSAAAGVEGFAAGATGAGFGGAVAGFGMAASDFGAEAGVIFGVLFPPFGLLAALAPASPLPISGSPLAYLTGFAMFTVAGFVLGALYGIASEFWSKRLRRHGVMDSHPDPK